MEDRNASMIKLRQNTSTKTIGDQAEQLAAEYLIQQGLRLLDRNFHSRFGEIDLIMQEQNTIVFVEVRYRHSFTTMHAEETIDARKCGRIIKTAESYIQSQASQTHNDYRIDVISMCGDLQDVRINWIPGAIEA